MGTVSDKMVSEVSDVKNAFCDANCKDSGKDDKKCVPKESSAEKDLMCDEFCMPGFQINDPACRAVPGKLSRRWCRGKGCGTSTFKNEEEVVKWCGSHKRAGMWAMGCTDRALGNDKICKWEPFGESLGKCVGKERYTWR